MRVDRSLRTGRELVVTRWLPAPRTRVFAAWTRPEELARWWPGRAALRVVRGDVRPGGLLHYRLRTPGAGDGWGRLVYRALVAPERLVFASAFADERGRAVRHPFRVDWPLEILTALTLAARGGGTCLALRAAPLAAMQSECETFEAAREALCARLERRLDRLAAHLAAARCGRLALEERRPWISDACSRLPSTTCPETSPCS